MQSRSRVTKAAKILLVAAAAVLAMQLVLFYMEVSFSSDKARHVLIQQIENLTHRDARIDGDVQVTISLLPQLLVERIHVANEEGFGEEDFITVSEARVRIALIPLLSGNVHLEELAADHTRVNLIRRENGSHNWSFDHLMQPRKPPMARPEVAAKRDDRRAVSIDIFELTDITINYGDEADDQVIAKHISKLVVDLQDSTEPHAVITGTFQDHVYDIAFESDPLEKIVLNEQWNLTGEGTVAGRQARIESVIQPVQQDIAIDVNVNVRNINLGQLLDHLGIVTGEEAASENLRLKASFQGDALSSLIENSVFELHLERGHLRWRAFVKDEIRELWFEKAVFSASLNDPVKIHLDGRLVDEVIRLDLITNPLSEFFDQTSRLDVDLTAHVAGSDITLKGAMDLPVSTRQFQLDTSIKGADLERLNRILNSELPPLNDYSLRGSISSSERRFTVEADDAKIGDTHFKGSIIVDTSSSKPFWIVNLDSRQLQISDFEFSDQSLVSEDAEATKTSLKKQAGEAVRQPGRRLKQIVDDPAMHFDLNIKADRVLAAEAALGGFSLNMKLRDDTLILQDAELDVPGGRIEAAASFKIENDFITGSLKLDADKFESGVVADYVSKGTRQGGLISARVDLQLGGKDFDRLLDKASGKLDVALWPRNISTGILDLWATNLFLVILPEIRKKETRMNCLVALMDLEDGIMKEDFFGIDTTKVWMHGNISVDFTNEHVILSLYPRSKKARLFAVQAPIRAEGPFDAIRLVTNPVDIAAAYLSFITSPLHVPARWVFSDKVPEDASATCERFYDREYIKQLKAKIEAAEQKEIDEWLESD